MLALLLATLAATASAAPVAGSTAADVFPPGGTSVDRGLFPDRTAVGFPHTTRTGAQPYAWATAPAAQFPKVQAPFGPVVLPTPKAPEVTEATKERKQETEGEDEADSPIFSWGYLSPRYSLPADYFGADAASSPIVPEGCALDAVHLLFRHGARYPTAGDAAELLASRLLNASQTGGFRARGDLAFLNDWTYKLGSDILVPFGRQQLYELGVRSRVAYGALLRDFTAKGTLPVFRTGSIDRMVESMEAFGAGFFGRDSRAQFSMSIAVENEGTNATVYPGGTCANAARDADAGKAAMAQFVNATFVDTAARLQRDIEGYDVTPGDAHTLMSLCAYETLALGYSAFCPLFTRAEFADFAYAYDLMFFYGNGPGAPSARAQGKGWVQEFLARLTHTPLPRWDSSTNATLDGNPETFPLNQSIYADAGHDSYLMSTFTALDLPLGEGALPLDARVQDRTFRSAALVPFNTHFAAQVMTCDGSEGQQIRFVLNDAVVPLSKRYEGCAEHKDGLCALETVVKVLQGRMAEIDYAAACAGPVPETTDQHS